MAALVRWNGGASSIASSGRPRVSSTALDKSIARLVFKHKGGVKVTVAFVKKKILTAKPFSDLLVERRMGEAGLKWLKRRRKSLVPDRHKYFRIMWANWVLRRTAATLSRWAYTDGTAAGAAGQS